MLATLGQPSGQLSLDADTLLEALTSAGLDSDLAKSLVDAGGGEMVRRSADDDQPLRLLDNVGISLAELQVELQRLGDEGLSLKVAKSRLDQWCHRHDRRVAAVLAAVATPEVAKSRASSIASPQDLRFSLDPALPDLLSSVVDLLAEYAIETPPLRDRVLDIPALSAHFLTVAGARHHLRPPTLSAGTERLFRRYPWPGNLRELANLCERLVILFPGVQVVPENLPRELISGDRSGEGARGFTLPPQGIDLNGLEAELIRQALALAGGNKSHAARLLGLTRDTLLYRIQKFLIPA